MKQLLFEIAIFAVIASIAFAITFGVIGATGSQFGVDKERAALFAVVFLFYWFPAFMCVHIAVSGCDGEAFGMRLCAGLRACGMLLCSAAVIAVLSNPGFSWRLGAVLYFVGKVFWLGPCFYEDRSRGIQYWPPGPRQS